MSEPTAPGSVPASTGPSGHHARAHVLSLSGKPGDAVMLPPAFSLPLRPDLVRRAVVATQARRRQPYGPSPTAGRRHSVEWSGKGKGVARTPRLMDSMRGAQAPNTVGGRPTHPPKVERIWEKKINARERRLAFESALAATRDHRLARARGHTVPDQMSLPVVIEDPLEEIQAASDARSVLSKLKLWPEVERAHFGVQYRSGRPRRRGRAHRTPVGILIVTSAPGRARGFRNLSGVDVVPTGRLGTEDLAPGGEPGRLTIFTPASLAALSSRLEEARP